MRLLETITYLGMFLGGGIVLLSAYNVLPGRGDTGRQELPRYMRWIGLALLIAGGVKLWATLR